MYKGWNEKAVTRATRKRGMSTGERLRYRRAHSRVAFAEAHLLDACGEPWHPRTYQRVSLESLMPRKVHCDGRDVGKTSEIEVIAAWASVMRPNSEMLIATQCENHLYPLMDRLVRRFEATPDIAGNLAEVKRTPSWHVRFSNGFVLWGRIAGPRGMNFQGLHVDWQIVDEAQEMTDAAWGELLQALNGGGWRWVYGVPNGLRTGFYRMSDAPEMSPYKWPSSLNPEFTPEKDAELARLYGGKRSPGYIHRVLGQHGEPAHAVFRLDDYLACVDEGVNFEHVTLREDDVFDVPPDAPRGEYYLGCDLGYARDPSEFVVYRAQEPHFVNVLHVHLEGVNYARQQAVIEAMDAVYSFQVIGIDAGNNGRAVAHQLMAIDDAWCAKVRAFEFGSSITVGALPDGREDRRPIKQFMTELLERRMDERSIVFPRLPDRESQYASHTYSLGQRGNVIFDKGNDHIIDADRCAVLARHLDTREEDVPPRLAPRVEGF